MRYLPCPQGKFQLKYCGRLLGRHLDAALDAVDDRLRRNNRDATDRSPHGLIRIGHMPARMFVARDLGVQRPAHCNVAMSFLPESSTCE